MFTKSVRLPSGRVLIDLEVNISREWEWRDLGHDHWRGDFLSGESAYYCGLIPSRNM